MTKIFNPKDWLAVPEQQKKTKKPINNNPTTVVANDIESYISSLEQSGIDITDTYDKWRDIGFAVSEEYGEAGTSKSQSEQMPALKPQTSVNQNQNK